MKIKSGATGEMVEARVGMVVSHPSMAVPAVIHKDSFTGLIKTVAILTVEGINHKYPADFARCTMLHYPFQDGDPIHREVEKDCGGHLKYWADGVFNGTDAMYRDYINTTSGAMKIRHASPDLRDAPEYHKP